MRKNYTLLKDLPDVKVGAIFEIGITLDAYYLTSDKTGTKYNCYCYPKDFVESNSEWFKLNMQKPPLGIIPMWLHNEKRYDSLMDAIKRYKEAGYDDEVFIKEWVAESQSLFAYLKGRAEEKEQKDLQPKMTTYEMCKNVLGDKTEQAIELAQNLLEVQLGLQETKIPNQYIDEYGRLVRMTKFGVSIIKSL